jgi:dienelactone hydrolase
MNKISTAALVLAYAVSVQAKLVTKDVSYEQNGTKLVGFLAYDDSKTSGGKVPGIVVFPEWWGLNEYIKGRAQQLADLGYVAFAADMYGDDQTTTDPAKAKELAGQFHSNPALMVGRAQAALDQLLKTGLVDETKVASVGFCFGGTTSLALAYSGAPLTGVVTFHGGLIPAPADVANKTKAKFLILHGALDPLVNKATVDAFLKSMNDGKFDFQFIEYSGALHAFTNPAADEAHAAGLEGVGYNQEAATRAWHQLQVFLTEIFG